jgi:hypothetical protein
LRRKGGRPAWYPQSYQQPAAKMTKLFRVGFFRQRWPRTGQIADFAKITESQTPAYPHASGWRAKNRKLRFIPDVIYSSVS